MTLEAVISCPFCGRPNQAHSGVDSNDEDVPTPGAIGICWGCRAIAVYDHDPHGRLTLRPPTGVELFEALDDPNVQSALQAMAVQPTPAEAVRAVADQRALRERPHYEDGGFAGGAS